MSSAKPPDGRALNCLRLQIAHLKRNDEKLTRWITILFDQRELLARYATTTPGLNPTQVLEAQHIRDQVIAARMWMPAPSTFNPDADPDAEGADQR